jgi:hypothetical protein
MIIKIDTLLPSLNEYIDACRYNKYKANNMKQKTETSIYYYILKSIGINKPNIDYPVDFVFIWREKNKKRDKDNVAFAKKFIFDAFVKYGILSGDGWAVVNNWQDKFIIDKENYGVTVEIKGVE